jgi:tetratricopeptide (TPR) repeat protein
MIQTADGGYSTYSSKDIEKITKEENGIIAKTQYNEKDKSSQVSGYAKETEDESVDKGINYFKNQKYDEAIDAFSRAIQINPNKADIYNNRGLSYKMKGDLDNAIIDFNKAVEIDPTYEKAYYNMGSAYFKKGDFDKAIKEFDKTIEINPGFVQAYANRASIYFRKKEYDSSWANMHKAEGLGFKFDPEFLRDLKRASGREK